mmetsp:Transcript_99490/g.290457  ORF Transcript_99490/g.290457 Transcript_99490/m.290457 type:complete len:204 (+) Transcript_99490:70-681(+)
MPTGPAWERWRSSSSPPARRCCKGHAGRGRTAACTPRWSCRGRAPPSSPDHTVRGGSSSSLRPSSDEPPPSSARPSAAAAPGTRRGGSGPARRWRCTRGRPPAGCTPGRGRTPRRPRRGPSRARSAASAPRRRKARTGRSCWQRPLACAPAQAPPSAQPGRWQTPCTLALRASCPWQRQPLRPNHARKGPLRPRGSAASLLGW